jgi:hypothetical protein
MQRYCSIYVHQPDGSEPFLVAEWPHHIATQSLITTEIQKIHWDYEKYQELGYLLPIQVSVVDRLQPEEDRIMSPEPGRQTSGPIEEFLVPRE